MRCVDLDELSSDDSVVDASPQDFKVTLLYDSDDSCTPVGSIVFSSDEDLPLSPGQDDRHKVRKRNTRPSSRSELMDRPATEPAQMEKSVETNNDSLMDKPPVDELPEWSDSELMPLITLIDSPVVDKTKMTDGPLPNGSEIVLPRSPEMVSFEDQDVSSAPPVAEPCEGGPFSRYAGGRAHIRCVAGLAGVQHAAGWGRPATTGHYTAPAVDLRQFQRPVLRSTDRVRSVSQDAGAGYPDDVANIQPAEGCQPSFRSVGSANSLCLGGFTRQYTMVNRGGHHKGRTLRCKCYPYGHRGKSFD